MNAKLITCLGPDGYAKYGRRFLESFQKYWPEPVHLEVWHHDLGVDELATFEQFVGVTYHSLNETESYKNIKAALGDQPTTGPALGYCFKAVALAQATTQELDWIGFVDADTETMQQVDDFLLEELFDNKFDLTYLYRKAVQESEGSFFAFNLRSPRGAGLISDYWGLYNSMEAFQYKKSHDNAVLDRLVMLHKAHGLQVKNLSEGALGLDAFHQSALGGYMVHYKGPDKQTIADPAMMQPARYTIVTDVMKQALQNTGQYGVIEVGTWNGTRAVHMAEAARQAGFKKLHYLGFDTFDEGNDRTHEGHTKPHARLAIVDGRLRNYAKVAKRLGFEFSFDLMIGNTMETMKDFELLPNDGWAFAYLDGGHSYETVKNDYEALRSVPYIAMDDIIVNEEEGAPDGPRRVFNEIAVGSKQLYTSGDGYSGLKQTISLGLVAAPGVKPTEVRTQLTVRPVDSVDKGEQHLHIAENARAIRKWPAPCQAHEKVALLVSAGPTLDAHLEDIRLKQRGGAVIFAVKHAFPILKKAGINPEFTVILDPRPVDGKSTHGVNRRSLFEKAAKNDKFLVATMTEPGVRKEIESKGCVIYGWHAQTQGTVNANLPEFQKGMVVGGGTCAATRMPMLAFAFGFRRLEFYGYDFYYPEGTKQENVTQKLMSVNLGANKRAFLTTGELVAAMQDLGVWTKWMVENGLSITFHGDGAGAVIWGQTVKDYRMPNEWPI